MAREDNKQIYLSAFRDASDIKVDRGKKIEQNVNRTDAFVDKISGELVAQHQTNDEISFWLR